MLAVCIYIQSTKQRHVMIVAIFYFRGQAVSFLHSEASQIVHRRTDSLSARFPGCYSHS